MKLQRNIAVFLLVISIVLLFREFNASRSTSDRELQNISGDSLFVSIEESGSPESNVHIINMSRRNSITKASNDVIPAVVGVSVKSLQNVRVRNPWSDNPFFKNFFPDQMRTREVSGLGSGFIISDDGYILTNDHVVENATEILVTRSNGETYNAKRMHYDFTSDIALLKIEGENFPYVPLGDSDELIIGEWAIAVGNPFGLFEINNKPTITVGVISATGQNFGSIGGKRIYTNMIQTDAAINPGNSGGPLVNANGEVIGMNAFIFSGGNNSEGSIGLGFAIPINKIKAIVSELKEHGFIDRAFYTGLKIQSIDRWIARRFGLNAEGGAIIVGLEKASPGEKAGLQMGDIIVQVINKRILKAEDVEIAISEKELKPGDKLDLVVFRKAQLINIELLLEKPTGE